MTNPEPRVDLFRFGLFVIALPEPLAGQIDALRRRFDPASAAIAPSHITVTQPLAEEPNDIGRADLGAVIAEFAPFDVTIGPAHAFPDSDVVYLAVEPAATILAVRQAAHATGLFTLDLPFADGFVPHATVREWPGDAPVPAEDVIRAADTAVPRARFRCESVELWRPNGAGRFAVVDQVALTGR